MHPFIGFGALIDVEMDLDRHGTTAIPRNDIIACFPSMTQQKMFLKPPLSTEIAFYKRFCQCVNGRKTDWEFRDPSKENKEKAG